jgi:hypothetical protein
MKTVRTVWIGLRPMGSRRRHCGVCIRRGIRGSKKEQRGAEGSGLGRPHLVNQ